MFSRRVQSWLVALSDPNGPRQPLPERPLRGGQAEQLVKLADRHSVLPAVAANLRRAAQAGGLAAGAAPELESAMEWANERLLRRTALSLAIRGQLAEIGAAFAGRDLAAVAIKGADFGDRLYPAPALRPFTDLDLLVPARCLAGAEEVMSRLGYAAGSAAMKYGTGYAQRSWRRPDRLGGTVEIHWNLVNSPTVRRGVSVEFDDLRMEAAPAGWRLPRPDASSLLLIAAVHGAASHAFDRLQLLWDVCQAAAGAAGKPDEDWLAEAASRTGSSTALAAALDLAERVLARPACGELISRLRLRRPGAALRATLTRGVVLRTHWYFDSFRRQIFRQLLKKRR